MSDAGALNSKKRLAQIVAILRKHHITQGLSPEKPHARICFLSAIVKN